MNILRMPKNPGTVKPRYYEAYYESVANCAKRAGIRVIFETSQEVWSGGRTNAYIARLDDKPFIMDFSDLKPFQLNPMDYKMPYFKWHYSSDYTFHMKHEHVKPLCVVQDFDWEEFEAVRREVSYTASGDTVTNNQRIKAAAKVRRTRVQNLLKINYKDKVSIDFMTQKNWWQSHSDCLLAVHVPGARNDMLDRGQWELMGLGVCVLSPEIVTVLADHRELVPFEHYVPVESDYSNLIGMIEWCRGHRDLIVDIGKNARQLFDSVGLPKVYWEYVRRVIDG